MSDKDTTHADAMLRYKTGSEAASQNHKRYREVVKFRHGDQWPEDIKSARGEKRPCLVVDKLSQYVRQVVNDGRQNRPSVKVSPVDDYGDKDVAEAFQGIIRHICDRSNADEALDTGLDCAVTGGFGYLRVCTEYANQKTFNQEIAVQRIRNPLSVIVEPNKLAADGSDITWAFVVENIPKEEFKSKWPKAAETDFKSDTYTEGWCTDEYIRVAEYWRKVEVPRTLHLLVTGETATEEEYRAAVANGQTIPIKETRQVPGYEVKWCRLSGAEVLEEGKWLGKYIPIVPIIGTEVDIDGKVRYIGLLEPGMDAQRLYNYSRSAFAERVALTPQSPWLAAAAATQNYEDEWETANKPDKAVLHWNHLDEEGNPIPEPTRINPADIPAGFAQDMTISEHDIQGALGMYASSLGQRGNATSGRQEIAQIREADTGTFHYQDNLNRAVRFLGRILVDLIPKIYDSKRAIRILGEDGEATQAVIDPNQQQGMQKIGKQTIYNLNVGEYDVSVSAGPSYTTKRQEASEGMLQMAKANPAVWQTHGDLIARAQDWPDSDAFAERFKKMLPPELQDAPDGEVEIPPEVKQAMQQVQQQQEMVMQAQAQLQEAAAQVEQERGANEATKAQIAAERAKLEAATAKLSAEHKVLDARFAELSAKLELMAVQKLGMAPPTEMPDGQIQPVLTDDEPLPDIGGAMQPPMEPPPIDSPPMDQPPQGF